MVLKSWLPRNLLSLNRYFYLLSAYLCALFSFIFISSSYSLVKHFKVMVQSLGGGGEKSLNRDLTGEGGDLLNGRLV